MFRDSHKISLIALTSIVLALPVHGQLQTTNTASTPLKPHLRAKLHTIKRRTAAVTPPVMLMQNTPPNYLSGEANVSVRGNQNPIVRLGLAQHGVTIVEFPASDRFFAIHPGDSDMVTVDDSPTKAKDHFMVLRAGSGFVVPSTIKDTQKQPTPATSIMVQMQSGIVLTFMIYPVPFLSQQAHRCVINYSRSEVVVARQNAGLAVNLDGIDPTAPVLASVTTINRPLPHSLPPPAITQAPTQVPPPVTVEVERRSRKLQGGITEPSAVAKSALTQAIKEPKQFKRWTPPLHGLALSTFSRDINEHSRLVVIAVRNMKAEAVRIMPGHPDMFIETLNDKGKSVQVEMIKKLHTETTTTSSVLPAGSTIFFAVVYETPILGTLQHLRVAVGQTNAADEPAATDLTADAR